jgi:hypothetical protein
MAQRIASGFGLEPLSTGDDYRQLTIVLWLILSDMPSDP